VSQITRYGAPSGVESLFMHELSIVTSVVESVTESLAQYPGVRVLEVRLRVGALSAVIEDSLQFCYGIAIEGTPLAGSKLVVNTVPVMVHCDACGKEGALESLRHFHCPHCEAPATDVRTGRELEIESIEIEEAEQVASCDDAFRSG
jgi:hydrogenase nickel incorporation protein HypA/HybF